MKSVIFDLDGTLLDTLGDIAAAANMVLESEGFTPRHTEDYRHIVGEGVDRLFEQAIGEPVAEDVIDRCVGGFDTAYAKTWQGITKPYEGIPELLNELTRRRIPMAVVSNKPHPFTQKCIENFLSDFRFDEAVGQSHETPKKPDPTGVLRIASRWGLDPTEVTLVGDTPTDIATALNAKMRPIGVSWGFRQPDELQDAGAVDVLGHPEALLDHLAGR